MIFFGVRASNIGNFEVPIPKCEYCGNRANNRISVFGRYAHIFWIPIFPIGKSVVSECVECKKTIKKKEFSPELKSLYEENKSKAKRPFWHWLGLMVITLFVAFVVLIGSSAEKDPRSELLQNDLDTMVLEPSNESDSISYKIKQVFDNFASEEIDPSEFEYLTRVENGKALVLVKIPNLRKVEKESRTQALEMIEMVTNNLADLKDKEKYIGVHGVLSFMLIKTPKDEQNSRLVTPNSLYEFYGPKPVIDK